MLRNHRFGATCRRPHDSMVVQNFDMSFEKVGREHGQALLLVCRTDSRDFS
jgi:hypothetical protein